MKKRKTNYKKIIRLIHKWMGLILGIQILFWVASGVIMSIFPLDMVRGEDRVAISKAPHLRPESFTYPISEIIQRYPNAQQVLADYWLEQAVYRVQQANNSLLVNASTGKLISPISSEMAIKVAIKDFKSLTSIHSVNEILKADGEVRGRKGKLWQVILDDDRNTRLYVSKSTGNVVARRNDVWRLYDFFWMLHIMDYDERSDFNNVFLQSFAVFSLLFVVSGFWLFLYSFRKRDFSWLLGNNKS